MDLISMYDAFFYKYTKCREQVALKTEQPYKSTIAQKKRNKNHYFKCVTRPNKGKKCVTDFIILQLRKVNLGKWPESENRFVHFYYEF